MTNEGTRDDMVERVATAIYREYEKTPKFYRGQMNGHLATDLARAAISAMREPTEAMVSRGDWIIEGHDQGVPSHAWNVFQAMIDAALSEQKGE